VRVAELQVAFKQQSEREREGQGFDWSWARRKDERGDKKQDKACMASRRSERKPEAVRR
jgi:hypothetical protein